MRFKALLVTLFVAGVTVSVALADPPPGKGKHKDSTPATTTATTTGTTGTTGTTTTTSSDRKVLLCHKTGSKKHPWVLIRVSKNAVKAHIKHGDVAAADGKCPEKAGGATETTPTTTTTTTPTTTVSTTTGS